MAALEEDWERLLQACEELKAAVPAESHEACKNYGDMYGACGAKITLDTIVDQMRVGYEQDIAEAVADAVQRTREEDRMFYDLPQEMEEEESNEKEYEESNEKEDEKEDEEEDEEEEPSNSNNPRQQRTSNNKLDKNSHDHGTPQRLEKTTTTSSRARSGCSSGVRGSL